MIRLLSLAITRADEQSSEIALRAKIGRRIASRAIRNDSVNDTTIHHRPMAYIGDYNILLGCIVAGLLLTIYYFVSGKHSYWKVRGVKGPTPLPLVGNFGWIFLKKSSVGELLAQVYEEYKSEPLVGVYSGLNPILIVKDPAFIKDILIKDFSVFADRGLFARDKVDVLASNLFRIEAKRWRPLRAKLSPTFSSGKLKNMFYLLKQCANSFGHYLDRLVSQEKVIDCPAITSKFTADVIGTCIFGIEVKAISDEHCEFLQMGKKIMRPRLKVYLKEFVRNWPWLFDIVGHVLLDHDVIEYFTQLVTSTIDYRLKNNIVRHDFMDILTDLKKNPEQLPELEVTEKLIVAQAVAFFIAGFFTSSNSMSHLLYELALNPHMQKRVRAEIMHELEKTNGDLEYDSVKKMDYFDAVFKESLRKYPPVTHLMRQSSADYTFSGTQVRIPKGQTVWIPVHSIHLDPALYPNPQVFDPERFMRNGGDLGNSVPYLAFGNGSRNCIGARFAGYQSKVGVIEILKNFKVDVCDESSFKYGDQPHQFLLVPTEGTYLKFTKLGRD